MAFSIDQQTSLHVIYPPREAYSQSQTPRLSPLHQQAQPGLFSIPTYLESTDILGTDNTHKKLAGCIYADFYGNWRFRDGPSAIHTAGIAKNGLIKIEIPFFSVICCNPLVCLAFTPPY